jgi:hypothetical protein
MTEGKYATGGRRTRVWNAQSAVEEAEAELLIPRPPPEYGRWARFETDELLAEVIERQRRGVSLLALWEIAQVAVVEEPVLALAA